MKMPKPTDDDRNYFRSLMPDDPEVEIKPMFGNLGAFANGQMFASLLGAPEIDGLLVGGASVEAASWLSIAQI